MIYEIVNPSDAYTLEADDLEVAAVACILVGEGYYALETRDGETVVPLMVFFSGEGWAQEKFGKSVAQMVKECDRGKVAACLESVVIGGFRERETYLEALGLIEGGEKRKQWAESWHEGHRSSLNDIGGRARALARALRESQGAGCER